MSIFSFLKTVFIRPRAKPETMDYENSASVSTPSPRKEVNSFESALDFVFRWEGGLSNDKDDRGGLTKYGISLKAYPDLDIRSLTLEQAKDIYLHDYWLAAGCNNMIWPTSLIIFDLAVNSGVKAAKLAYSKYGEGPVELIKYRRDRYEKIVKKNPSQKKFLKGWLNRMDDLQKVCGL